MMATATAYSLSWLRDIATLYREYAESLTETLNSGTPNGLMFTTNELSGIEYGYFHFPSVKKEYKTQVEELLCNEAIKYLKSLKMTDIRTRIPPTHALAKSVARKMNFQQHELSWRVQT